MDLVIWTLAMMLALVVGLFVLLVSGVIYTVFTDSVLPEGIQGPGKLRLIYGTQVAIGTLGNIAQNLGLGTQITFVRYLRSKVLRTKHKEDAGLVIQDVQFDGVPVRVYQPRSAAAGKRRGILFFHGGGWVFGSIDDYEHLCWYIAKETGSVVVSVEYRLAPEHRYPTQFEDCLNATLHFLKTAEDYGVDSSRIVVSGDSAGGNLTAAVCLRITAMEESSDLPALCAQVLIYPALQMVDFNLPSYQQNQYVPLLFRTRMVFFVLQYLNGDMSLGEDVLSGQHLPVELKNNYRKWIKADLIPSEFQVRGHKPNLVLTHDDDVYDLVKPSLEPTFSPLLASDAAIGRLPPAYILTCEFDVLRDDGLLFKKRLEDKGVPVSWYHVQDGFHGIISFFDNGYLTFPSGKQAVDNIVSFLKDI
ncbi:arylacetamide deacetylase-like 4 isoform X1 [Carcharodon carcharias]|uniref:arylacetamide deacetylase-like 4 isoform X1 n=1 Tax=Carcharodon carcharias TaxID=13397 RepID=UPI001B7F0CCE|nr:arylacetamide deacetylase-like 4 isoform X1 [Carcharodon carcharias]